MFFKLKYIVDLQCCANLQSITKVTQLYTWYHLYVESKILHKGIYLQNRNRFIAIENRLVLPRHREGEAWTGILGLVQFSCSVVSDSLQPHELQNARHLCPSPTPGLYPNSCPLSHWCHLTTSSCVVPFSCPQSFPTSGSFQVSQLFTSGGQRIGVSASASVLPMNIQDWFFSRIDWLELFAVQETPKSLLQCHSSKASILQCSTFFMVQLSHLYMSTGKTIALTRWTFVGIVMSLFFNMLLRFVMAFLPRSKCLLISWLQSPSTVILEPKK